MKDIKIGAIDGVIHISIDEFEKVISDVKAEAIDELVGMVAKYYTMQERAGYYSDTNNMIKQRIADFGEQLKEKND